MSEEIAKILVDIKSVNFSFKNTTHAPNATNAPSLENMATTLLTETLPQLPPNLESPQHIRAPVDASMLTNAPPE